jgi:hypothetical protein
MSAYAASCSYKLNSLYRVMHSNHPFLRWMLNDETNMDWVKEYGIMLIVEFAVRHSRDHAGAKHIREFVDDFDKPIGLEPTAFLNRTWNDELDFRFEPDVHKAYRWFVAAQWAMSSKKLSWGHRMPPEFFIQHMIARTGKDIVTLGEENGVVIN